MKNIESIKEYIEKNKNIETIKKAFNRLVEKEKFFVESTWPEWEKWEKDKVILEGYAKMREETRTLYGGQWVDPIKIYDYEMERKEADKEDG